LENVLERPFPYGPLTIERLEAFETEIGWALPNDFRNYLLNYNGAQFVKNIYSLSDDGWNSVDLHHVHGLHDGPPYFQLQQHWKLYECFDLRRWKRKLARFVVFADTGTGDQWAISGKDGSVWLYEHDAVSGLFRMPGRFTRVEKSFSNFVAKLETEAENDLRLEGDPRFESFKKRLADAKEYSERKDKEYFERKDTETGNE